MIQIPRGGAEIQMKENVLGTKILGAALSIHRELGPGLLEIKSVERVIPSHKKRFRPISGSPVSNSVIF